MMEPKPQGPLNVSEVINKTVRKDTKWNKILEILRSKKTMNAIEAYELFGMDSHYFAKYMTDMKNAGHHIVRVNSKSNEIATYIYGGYSEK